MAGNRTIPFINVINQACASGDALAIIEGMRIFGYVNEIEYSELTTAWTKMTERHLVREDGAETIELARAPKEYSDPEEIPGMIPREY